MHACIQQAPALGKGNGESASLGRSVATAFPTAFPTLCSQVQAWLYFLEHTNGHYKFRWGDAPVHTITLGMFMPKQQVLEFGFAYLHGGARGVVYPAGRYNGPTVNGTMPRWPHPGSS